MGVGRKRIARISTLARAKLAAAAPNTTVGPRA